MTTYDQWKTTDPREYDPEPEQPPFCGTCDAFCDQPENAFGEFMCRECESNRAEAAYERFCEDFHDGGATQFKSLAEQQAEARRLK